MAKTCLRIKAQRPPKFKVRAYNRCPLCGRPRAFYRRFQMCRLCLRDAGAQGGDPRPDQGELVRVPPMAMTDPIADLLTRIRNGAHARKEQVDVPWSRVKARIVEVLTAEGYLKEHSVVEQDGHRDPARVAASTTARIGRSSPA